MNVASTNTEADLTHQRGKLAARGAALALRLSAWSVRAMASVLGSLFAVSFASFWTPSAFAETVAHIFDEVDAGEAADCPKWAFACGRRLEIALGTWPAWGDPDAVIGFTCHTSRNGCSANDSSCRWRGWFSPAPSEPTRLAEGQRPLRLQIDGGEIVSGNATISGGTFFFRVSDRVMRDLIPAQRLVVQAGPLDDIVVLDLAETGAEVAAFVFRCDLWAKAEYEAFDVYLKDAAGRALDKMERSEP